MATAAGPEPHDLAARQLCQAQREGARPAEPGGGHDVPTTDSAPRRAHGQMSGAHDIQVAMPAGAADLTSRLTQLQNGLARNLAGGGLTAHCGRAPELDEDGEGVQAGKGRGQHRQHENSHRARADDTLDLSHSDYFVGRTL